jgi:hypothetical protein
MEPLYFSRGGVANPSAMQATGLRNVIAMLPGFLACRAHAILRDRASPLPWRQFQVVDSFRQNADNHIYQTVLFDTCSMRDIQPYYPQPFIVSRGSNTADRILERPADIDSLLGGRNGRVDRGRDGGKAQPTLILYERDTDFG